MHQKFILQTWYWKSLKNPWPKEAKLFNKVLEIQANKKLVNSNETISWVEWKILRPKTKVWKVIFLHNSWLWRKRLDGWHSNCVVGLTCGWHGLCSNDNLSCFKHLHANDSWVAVVCTTFSELLYDNDWSRISRVYSSSCRTLPFHLLASTLPITLNLWLS